MFKTKNSSHAGKLVVLQDLQVTPFVDGLRKAALNFIKLQPGSDFIVLNASKNLLIAFLIMRKKLTSFIVELVRLNKKMTLIDKSNVLNKNTLPMKLFLIVVQELISKEKDYNPFWNEQYEELSEKLWLPIKTDCQDLPLTLSNGSLSNEMEKSQYWMKKFTSQQSKNLQKTYSQLCISTHADKWDGDDIKLKTLKIRLRISSKQKQILLDWMNTTRYVFNKTLNQIKNYNHSINFYDLRNKLVIAKNNTLTDWELKTPKDVRAGAVKDVVTAYKTAFTNLKRNNICKFDINFKTKKSNSDILTIPKSAIKVTKDGFNIYPTYIKEFFKCNSKNFHMINIKHDCKIVRQRKEYHILIPVDCSKTIKKTDKVVAGDLGTRTFLTCYDSTSIVEFHRNKYVLKKLTDKIDSMKANRKRNYKIAKAENKIKNIISDLHWRTAVYLTDNYDTIFMGKLESQKLAQKSNNRKLNRDLNIFSHYKFMEKLKYLCITKHRNLVMVNEAYTSQTCPKCGKVTKTTEKKWHCNECYLEMDRDFLGARNILMKGIVSGARSCSFKVLDV